MGGRRLPGGAPCASATAAAAAAAAAIATAADAVSAAPLRLVAVSRPCGSASIGCPGLRAAAALVSAAAPRPHNLPASAAAARASARMARTAAAAAAAARATERKARPGRSGRRAPHRREGVHDDSGHGRPVAEHWEGRGRVHWVGGSGSATRDAPPLALPLQSADTWQAQLRLWVRPAPTAPLPPLTAQGLVGLRRHVSATHGARQPQHVRRPCAPLAARQQRRAVAGSAQRTGVGKPRIEQRLQLHAAHGAAPDLAGRWG
jgi:hypothetical protein